MVDQEICLSRKVSCDNPTRVGIHSYKESDGVRESPFKSKNEDDLMTFSNTKETNKEFMKEVHVRVESMSVKDDYDIATLNPR